MGTPSGSPISTYASRSPFGSTADRFSAEKCSWKSLRPHLNPHYTINGKEASSGCRGLACVGSPLPRIEIASAWLAGRPNRWNVDMGLQITEVQELGLFAFRDSYHLKTFHPVLLILCFREWHSIKMLGCPLWVLSAQIPHDCVM